MIQPYQKRDGEVIRERMMIYGPPESGKTSAVLRMARYYADTDTPGTFYIVSTDLAYEALLTDPEFEDLEGRNLVVENVDPGNMQSIIDAGKKFKRLGTLDDWFSLDLAGDAWKAASDEYANAKSKGKIDNVAEVWKTDGGDEFPIKGWEWGMPNARFRYLMNNVIRNFPGHVVCVSGQKEILSTSGSGKTAEKPLVKETFGHIGYKPDTKAEDEAYRFHTILHFSGNRAKRFQVTTAKERFKYRRLMGTEMSNGSGMWMGEEYEDFFMDYFILNAKWKM